MTTPHFSILIPFYKSTEFLEECLESIINQTYQNWEVIIGIHGCGEEGGEECMKIQELSHKDARIRTVIVSKALATKINVLNALLNESNGEWISIMDKNDKWHPEKLAKQLDVKSTVAKNAAVIGTAVDTFGDVPYTVQQKSEWITPVDLSEFNPVSLSSAILHRSYLHMRLMDGNCGIEDYELWMRILLSGSKIYNIPEVLTHMRVTESIIRAKTQNPMILHVHYKKALTSPLAITTPSM